MTKFERNTGEIENRKTKFETYLKVETGLFFEFLIFGFVSSFVIRPSNFLIAASLEIGGWMLDVSSHSAFRAPRSAL
jgi:hypothetical protein